MNAATGPDLPTPVDPNLQKSASETGGSVDWEQALDPDGEAGLRRLRVRLNEVPDQTDNSCHGFEVEPVAWAL